jgi:hypothetical protein
VTNVSAAPQSDPENKSFKFFQCVNILKTTGQKACSLRELRDLIATISEESIFHHMCEYFLKGIIGEYTNDFAEWVAQNLEERALAEHLSNMDPYMFKTVQDVRIELLRIIDEYTKSFPEARRSFVGDEFYFLETITLVFPVGIRARNLAEFLVAIRNIDHVSIYFHFYDARIRLGSGVDDFSKWIDEVLENKELADKIRSIDPFMHSIEGIREHIMNFVEESVSAEMKSLT